MSVIDDLKRLERAGDEQSKANQKLAEAATRIQDENSETKQNRYPLVQDHVHLKLRLDFLGLRFQFSRDRRFPKKQLRWMIP